jgi:hypothetical protein
MTERDWKVGDEVRVLLVGAVTDVTKHRLHIDWPAPLTGGTVHVRGSEKPNGASRACIDPYALPAPAVDASEREKPVREGTTVGCAGVSLDTRELSDDRNVCAAQLLDFLRAVYKAALVANPHHEMRSAYERAALAYCAEVLSRPCATDADDDPINVAWAAMCAAHEALGGSAPPAAHPPAAKAAPSETHGPTCPACNTEDHPEHGCAGLAHGRDECRGPIEQRRAAPTVPAKAARDLAHHEAHFIVSHVLGMAVDPAHADVAEVARRMLAFAADSTVVAEAIDAARKARAMCSEARGQRDAALAEVARLTALSAPPPAAPSEITGAVTEADLAAIDKRSAERDARGAHCVATRETVDMLTSEVRRLRGRLAGYEYLRAVVTLARAEPSLPTESVIYQAGVPGRVGDAQHEAAYAFSHPAAPSETSVTCRALGCAKALTGAQGRFCDRHLTIEEPSEPNRSDPVLAASGVVALHDACDALRVARGGVR